MNFRVFEAFDSAGCWFLRRTSTLPIVKRKNTLFVLAFILGLVLIAAAFPPGAQAANRVAPPFSLKSIDGANFNLNDFQGEVVVLDLMATWCPVCNDAMKEFSQLRRDNPEVVIITISVDPTETDEKLRSFKEEYNADWLFARDTDNVLVKYQAFVLPTIVVIDPQGGLSYQEAALVPAKELSLEVARAYAGGIEEPEEPEETVPTATGLYVLALVTGLLSFFAPCAFPLLPGYITYYLGRYEGGPTLKGSVKAGIAAATGINGMFALIGAVVAAGGIAVKSYVTYFAPGVGVAIVLLGLVMVLGRAEIFEKFGGRLSSYSSKFGGGAEYSGLFMYGVGYGLASMGCQAPVFIALIFAGLGSGGALEAFLVFLSFSIGMGSMMLAISVVVGTAKMKMLVRIRTIMPYINRACGVALILVGIYFLWKFL